MILFGLALGALELIALSVFFIMLVIAVTFDRRGVESPKWWVVGGGLALAATYLWWKDWTFGLIWETVSTWQFWKPFVWFLGAGLLYSVLEFMLDVRRSARRFKDLWDKHIDGRREAYADAKLNGPASADFQKVADSTREFVDRFGNKHALVTIVRGEDKISVEPKINKVELAESIGAWTFFWPVYAVSLILGDLLTEVFRVIAEFFVKLSGRFVRMSFADVFKF